MATPDDIQKQLASRQPKVTPVGDVPAATARAAAPGAMDVPNATPTAQATTGSAQTLTTAPGASAGPASSWSTTPGAQEPTLTRSAAQITDAPAWQTSPGAGAPPGTIDVPSTATRATQVPLNGANGSLPKPGTPTTTDPNDITADFEKRMRYETERRARLAAETAQPAPAAAAAEPAAAPAAGAATGDAAAATGPRSFRLTPAASDAAQGAEAAAPGILRRIAGAGGHLVGAVAAPVLVANGVNEVGAAVKNMGDAGVNATNTGDALAGAGNAALGGSIAKSLAAKLLTKAGAEQAGAFLGTKVLGRAIPVVGAASLGWDTGRAIAPVVNRGADAASGISDTIGGTVNQIVHGAGKLIGQDWGADEADQERFARANSQAAYNEMHGRKAWDNGPAPGTAAAGAAGAPNANGKPPVNFIAPGDTTTRPPVLSDMTAAEAMKSNIPGTAVINGHVLTKEEIDDAGKRLNIVPSTAFTNPVDNGIEGNLNGTVNSDGGMMRVPLGNSASAQRMFGTDTNGAPVGVSGGIGAPQDARQSTIHNLMGQISDALRSGRRRTAKILVDQLSAFDRASQGQGDLALREQALNKEGRPTPQTAAQAALDVARAQEAGIQNQVAQMGLAQAKQAQAIQQALQVETDPGKRKVLQQNLAAITGKGGSSAAQLTLANFTTGQGLDTRTIPIPIDMTTGKPVVSPEYIQLIQSLQGGQPQAPQQKG